MGASLWGIEAALILRGLITLAVSCSLALASTVCTSTPLSTFGKNKPITGYTSPSLEPFDRVMTRLIDKYQIPGGSLAVARDGRLVLARGYGWADVAAKEAVQPESLFRLASLTKPITAVATLHLGESLVFQGIYPDLNAFLSEKAFDLVDVQPYSKITDPRLKNITIRDLLQHSGGWNRYRVGDPMFRPTLEYIAKGMGKPQTLSNYELISYMMGKKLSFTPGTFSAYSNLGYSVLGRIIEKISGRSYQAYVSDMLREMEIYNVYSGKTRKQDRLSGEVHYYDYPGAPLVKSVLDGQLANRPYGEFYLETQDANGGLVTSAPTLVKFVATLEGLRTLPSPISLEARQEMIKKPGLKAYLKAKRYYALGWGLRLKDEGLEWSHDGAFAGTRTLLLRLPDGTIAAALFNSRPYRDWRFIDELRKSLENAAKAVQSWPDYDCFD